MVVSVITPSLQIPLHTNPISSSSSLPALKVTYLKTPNRENKLVCSVSVKSGLGSFFKGGSGVLERPNFDQSQFTPMTQAEEGGDIGRVKNKGGNGSGDSYRVLLVDDERHSEKLVVKILPQAPDDARKLFLESRENSVAVVIVAVKVHVTDLMRTGLPRNKENAADILLSLCKRDNESLARISRLGALVPLSELAESGSERAKRKARSLLKHLQNLQQP